MKDKVHKNNDYFDKRYDLYSKRYDRLKTLIDQVNHYCEQESELKYRVVLQPIYSDSLPE